jgi:cytoskeleton protein RodZ
MNNTAIEIGQTLRATREARAIPIEEISVALKIRTKYLMALEEGNVKELPSAVYLIGYLKSYADFLGLESDALIEHLRSEQEHRPQQTELYLPEPYRKDFHPKPVALVLSVVLTVGIYALWHYYHNEGRFSASPQQTISEVLNTSGFTNYTPIPSAATYPGTIGTSSQTLSSYRSKSSEDSASGNDAIILLAKASSWVKILDNNGQLIAERALNAGDTYFVSNHEGLVITAGNPDAIEVMRNGEFSKLNMLALQHSSAPGKITTGRFLDSPARQNVPAIQKH